LATALGSLKPVLAYGGGVLKIQSLWKFRCSWSWTPAWCSYWLWAFVLWCVLDRDVWFSRFV